MRLRLTKAGVLAGAGVLLTGAAVIAGFWGGSKVKERIEEAEEEKGEELTNVEVAKAVAPVVAPAAVTGVLAMMCVILSHRSSLKYEASLVGLSAASAAELKKHKKEIENALYKVVKKGEPSVPKPMEVQLNQCCKTQEDAADWPVIESNLPIPTADDIYDTGRGDDLVYDAYSNRWFRTSLFDLMESRYHLNRNFHKGLPTTYNDWCNWIGVEDVPYGEDNGWPMDYMIVNESPWIDIYGTKMQLKNGQDFTFLVYFLDPVAMNEEYM